MGADRAIHAAAAADRAPARGGPARGGECYPLPGLDGLSVRMLPRVLPPASTVQRYFYDWRDCGLWATISNALVMHGYGIGWSGPPP